MKYILADTEKALAAGFSTATHYAVRKKMVLTEKEITMSVRLGGTFDERVATVGGSVVTLDELNSYRVGRNKLTITK